MPWVRARSALQSSLHPHPKAQLGGQSPSLACLHHLRHPSFRSLPEHSPLVIHHPFWAVVLPAWSQAWCARLGEQAGREKMPCSEHCAFTPGPKLSSAQAA